MFVNYFIDALNHSLKSSWQMVVLIKSIHQYNIFITFCAILTNLLSLSTCLHSSMRLFTGEEIYSSSTVLFLGFYSELINPFFIMYPSRPIID